MAEIDNKLFFETELPYFNLSGEPPKTTTATVKSQQKTIKVAVQPNFNSPQRVIPLLHPFALSSVKVTSTFTVGKITYTLTTGQSVPKFYFTSYNAEVYQRLIMKAALVQDVKELGLKHSR